MAVYLKTVPGKGRGPEPALTAASMTQSSDIGPPKSEDAGTQGRRIFEGACASCHAWNGRGQQTELTALRGLRSVSDPDGRNVVQTVLRGGRVDAPQGRAWMPAFGRAYSDAEVAAVSNYVIAHFGGQTGKVTAEQVAKARRE